MGAFSGKDETYFYNFSSVYVVYFSFLSAGFLSDRFLSKRYIICFLATVILGVGNGFLPISGHHALFFFIIFILGGGAGCLNTLANILCLDIWRGFGGDSWMHSAHFSHAIGAFLGPSILSNLFLLWSLR